MVSYTSKSLNFFYPQNLRKKGEFPYITLTKPKTHNNLTILLLNRDEIFDRRYDERYNPLVIGSSTGSRIEIIRAGEYAEFPGSKEIITRQMAELGAFYTWQLLVPVGQRLVEISIFTDTSNELDELWKPIVDSMKFDIDQINRLRDDEIICRNWTKESTKSKRFKHSFTSEYLCVAFHDSEVEFFSDDSSSRQFDMSDFSEDLLAKNYFKHDNILILKTFTDPLDWLVTFCLSSDFPSEKGWHYIIEGLLGLESGKLYATPIENTELEIKMKPGVYRFRVYFGPNKNNDECWQIYFWPTDEPETNEVKIIKPYASGSFPD